MTKSRAMEGKEQEVSLQEGQGTVHTWMAGEMGHVHPLEDLGTS